MLDSLSQGLTFLFDNWFSKISHSTIINTWYTVGNKD